jgi:2-keto-4-pentenoate hydratase/2-oxohepta-3-ene-1,7-dioic acid hydratase in catechol pathway
MKLASFARDGKACFGAVTNDGLIDLTSAVDGIATLKDVIEQDGLASIREASQSRPATIGLDEVEFQVPVLSPEKIWCIGVNYGDRNAEYKDGSALPKYPSLFCRTPSSFIGHDVPLVRPSVSEQLDYEGEIVIVIGREGPRGELGVGRQACTTEFTRLFHHVKHLAIDGRRIFLPS